MSDIIYTWRQSKRGREAERVRGGGDRIGHVFQGSEGGKELRELLNEQVMPPPSLVKDDGGILPWRTQSIWNFLSISSAVAFFLTEESILVGRISIPPRTECEAIACWTPLQEAPCPRALFHKACRHQPATYTKFEQDGVSTALLILLPVWHSALTPNPWALLWAACTQKDLLSQFHVSF